MAGLRLVLLVAVCCCASFVEAESNTEYQNDPLVEEIKKHMDVDLNPHLSSLSTSIKVLQKEMVKKISALETEMRQKMEDLPTNEMIRTLRERVEHLLEVVQTCGNALELNQTVEEVKQATEGMQSVLTTAGETQAALEEVKREVGGLHSILDSNLVNINEKVEEISSVTQQLAISPEEQGDPGPATPCLDSDFPGSENDTVCQQAVKLGKCSWLRVSYHCCETCTNEGKIPVDEMGPWRYLNLPRNLSALEVIRIFG